MSRHAAPRSRARTSGRVRPSTVGLLAAAMTPLVAFGIAPAFAGTTTADTADAAGNALGLDDVLGSLPGDTPVVDVELPDVCLDLSAEVDRLQGILDGAGTEASEAQRAAVANAKLALGTCVDENTDPPTSTTPTAPPTSTPPSSTNPLPPPLGGTGGTGGDDQDCADFADRAAAQAHFDADRSDPDRLDRDGDGVACEVDESTERIPANADGATQAERQGSNTQVTIPRGAADTGDGSFPAP